MAKHLLKLVGSSLLLFIIHAWLGFVPCSTGFRLNSVSSASRSWGLRSSVLYSSSRAIPRLMQQLDPSPVFLIGIMGCGKTSIGHKLAERLPEYDLYDTDDILRRRLGTSISSMVASKGEKAFRELEGSILQEASQCMRAVISTGGGIVTSEANWQHLNTGPVIFLDTPVSVIAKRLMANNSEISTRPLLSHLSLEEAPELTTEDRSRLLTKKLEILLSERRKNYERAHVVVSLGDWAIDHCVDVVLNELSKFLT